MLVSVITSVYNCENYVKEMLDSVVNQTMQDWEMILIDDASTDSTWDIISKFKDDRIIKIQNKENIGLTRNLNKALSLAKGKYIVRMDGDDIAYSGRFEKQVQYMEEHLDVVLSGCWIKRFGDRNDICKSLSDYDILRIDLLFNAVMFHPTFIFRREISEKYNIKYNEELLYAQDYDFEFQMSKCGKITNMEDVLVKYRVHENQISVNKFINQQDCARRIARNILKELDIIITEKELDWWYKYCALDYHLLVSEEVEVLKKISNLIVERNKTKKIYNDDKLVSRIKQRLFFYIEKCNSASSQLIKEVVKGDKYQELFQMMCQWFHKKKRGKSIEQYLKEYLIQDIAIYGMGDAGRVLQEELRGSKINVKYGIDRDINVSYFENSICIKNVEDDLEDVDAIIVTSIAYYEQVRKALSVKMNCLILSLDNIIYEM